MFASVFNDAGIKDWDTRLLITQPGFRTREPLLNMRRTVLDLLNDLGQVVCASWLVMGYLVPDFPCRILGTGCARLIVPSALRQCLSGLPFRDPGRTRFILTLKELILQEQLNWTPLSC